MIRWQSICFGNLKSAVQIRSFETVSRRPEWGIKNACPTYFRIAVSVAKTSFTFLIFSLYHTVLSILIILLTKTYEMRFSLPNIATLTGTNTHIVQHKIVDTQTEREKHTECWGTEIQTHIGRQGPSDAHACIHLLLHSYRCTHKLWKNEQTYIQHAQMYTQ